MFPNAMRSAAEGGDEILATQGEELGELFLDSGHAPPKQVHFCSDYRN